MEKYTLTIAREKDGVQESVFEFYTESQEVLYTLDKLVYQKSLEFLQQSLDYMKDTPVEQRQSIKN